MLRIHFTAEDIGKVRLTASPDPMWETVFSVYRLREQRPPLVFERWRRNAVRTHRPADFEILSALIPGGYFPDFLTPAESSGGLAAGLDSLLHTPAARLRRDVELLARQQPRMPSWMSGLAGGDPAALRLVASAIRSYHEAVVAPAWPDARAHIDAECAKRTRAFLEGGCEGLLRSYLPMMRWNPPFLEVDTFRYERTIHLGGRGLTLMPGYLSWGTHDVLNDPGLPPILVYPIEKDPAMIARQGRPGDSVVALIGMTRTAVLESIRDGRTTSELARRVGVSAASISQHTTVLRQAGLIRTSRLGKAVLHTMTPLGTALLETDPAPGARREGRAPGHAGRRRPAEEGVPA